MKTNNINCKTNKLIYLQIRIKYRKCCNISIGLFVLFNRYDL